MKLVLLSAFALGAAFAAAAWLPSPPRQAFAVGETCTPARPHASGTSVVSINTADGTRSYRLHVPPSYTGADPLPLLFGLHGLGSNAIEQEVYSGFSAKADSAGFIAVYPDGLTVGFGQQHWNAWQFTSPQPDDVGFISAIISSLSSSLCIDQSRVYTSGMSNGAMMSVRLACSLSSRIAAFAPVAGAYYPPMSNNLNAAETCPDTAARPMIAFHGTADSTVPFNGGGDLNYRLPIDDNTPAEDVLSDWAAHNGCAGSRQETQIDTEVRLIEYGSCAGGAPVQLYAVDGGGHTWPGSFDVPSLGYTTHQISATDLIWSFFSNYTLPDADVDLVPDSADNCPADANFSQQNSDADFIDLSPPKQDDLTWPNSDAPGDACDADDDNDGLADTTETAGPPCASASAPTDPLVRDSDGDRALDGAECAAGTNPNDYASKPTLMQCATAAGAASITTDSDGDGVTDAVEFCYYNSSTANTNTDGDTCGDAREVVSVNGDKTVNAADLGLVASSFGFYAGGPPPYPAYLVDYDVNRDGSVNAADLGLVASKFGLCP